MQLEPCASNSCTTSGGPPPPPLFLPRITRPLTPHTRPLAHTRAVLASSIDDNSKSTLSYTDAVPLIQKLIHSFPQRHVAKELGALAINLSLHSRNAGAMCCAPTQPADGLPNQRPPLVPQSCWPAWMGSA